MVTPILSGYPGRCVHW